MLKLNDSKTELMLVTSKRSKHLHNLPTSITIGNAQIPFKQSVKNLGFTLDCHLTMNAHVSNIARTCYFELRRLASIRRFLTSTATATLVVKLINHDCLPILMLWYIMLYIVLAYLMLFAALTNSVCLNNASLFFSLFFNIFYERAMSSPEK